jgi:hypothetical protein
MGHHPDHIEHVMSRFFSSLPTIDHAHDTFDQERYRPAPDDWALVVTDVVDSTTAIAGGRHKTVNFVAAMAIAALKNLCAPELIPFLFGGDGAVVMVPPHQIARARAALARVRGLAAREFGLSLRVGLATVAELRHLGSDLKVGRYEPSPGNSFGVFLGGAVALLESTVRGRGDPDLIGRAAIADSMDDRAPIDLSGLSCRWDALRATRGKMLALIIQGAVEPREIYMHVMRLAGQDGDPRPASLDNLHVKWPSKGFMLEARARRRGGSLAMTVLYVLGASLVARLLFGLGRPTGAFDPERYRREITRNTDFSKHDDTVCFVIDCPLDGIDAIKRYLDDCASRQMLRYGMNVSDTALMTCLVTSTNEGLHVHFVDGGGGGYTNAAKSLKAARGAAGDGIYLESSIREVIVK